MKECSLFVTILYILLTCSGCGSSSDDLPVVGGGSGGSDNTQAALEGAIADLNLEPRNIKLGNKAIATAYLSEISEDGVLLKIRFPKSLEYEDDTSFIDVDGEWQAIDPALGPLEGKSYKFIIYLLTRDSFDSSRSGRIQLQFRAIAVSGEDAEESVGVDLQKHEPGEDPADEFDISKPLFSAEASRDLEVTR